MVICAGEALIDFVPQGTAVRGSDLPGFTPVAGGSPFNCAIAAARLGAAGPFASAISTDMFGEHLVERLRAENVDLSLVQRNDRPSTLAFVKRDPSGSASYAFLADGAADRSFSLEKFPAHLPEGGVLQFGSISLIGDPAGRAVLDLVEREQANRVVAFDPNIRPTVIVDEADYRARLERALRASAVLKTSNEDLEWMFPGLPLDEAVQASMERGVRVVIVTRGADGPEAFVKDKKRGFVFRRSPRLAFRTRHHDAGARW